MKLSFQANATLGELLKLEKLPGPLLIDNMKNEASTWYGSFPDRLYIILDGKVVYQVIWNFINLLYDISNCRVKWDLMDTVQQKLRNGLKTFTEITK